jgi:hypothetical protein
MEHHSSDMRPFRETDAFVSCSQLPLFARLPDPARAWLQQEAGSTVWRHFQEWRRWHILNLWLALLAGPLEANEKSAFKILPADEADDPQSWVDHWLAPHALDGCSKYLPEALIGVLEKRRDPGKPMHASDDASYELFAKGLYRYAGGLYNGGDKHWESWPPCAPFARTLAQVTS